MVLLLCDRCRYPDPDYPKRVKNELVAKGIGVNLPLNWQSTDAEPWYGTLESRGRSKVKQHTCRTVWADDYSGRNIRALSAPNEWNVTEECTMCRCPSKSTELLPCGHKSFAEFSRQVSNMELYEKGMVAKTFYCTGKITTLVFRLII